MLEYIFNDTGNSVVGHVSSWKEMCQVTISKYTLPEGGAGRLKATKLLSPLLLARRVFSYIVSPLFILYCILYCSRIYFIIPLSHV